MYITDSNAVATRSKLGMKFMAILCLMGFQTFVLAQTDTSAKYKIAPPKVWETNKTS